jgi:penicillin-binding protein 1B
MGLNVKGYPSVALGAFEVTPLELAGAYTAFANEGKRCEPHALLRVVAPNGRELKRYDYPTRQVLRPEIAYLMTSLMQGVIDRGTVQEFARVDSSCLQLERPERLATAGLQVIQRISL